jgi:hypothetical protein
MPYWISVNSRLPEDSKFVLTYAPDYQDFYYVDMVIDGEWIENTAMDIVPTHWMELPKPPIIRESNNE